ncbi:MAG: hypothetical protein O2887_08220 [Bacteroidetes bacterium]|nr:hypothetical protein [Bacteroidota bacterium]MDA1120463.1 hypothetical protein [Bacteroidota bacterium]
MKKIYAKSLLTVVLSIILFLPASLAQTDCGVELASIQGKYEGDCKNGLANGNGKSVGTDTYEGEFKKGLPDGYGVYTWSDGNVYSGEFKKGLREGKGEMAMAVFVGADSLLVGYWDKDEYVGTHEKPYELHFQSSDVSGVTVKRSDNKEGNVLYVTIGRLQSKDIVNPVITVSPSVGFYKMIVPGSRTANIHVVEFPFRFILSHEGDSADIEIFDEGSYDITMNKKDQRAKGQ